MRQSVKPLEQDLLRLRRLANRAAEIAIDDDFKEIIEGVKERIIREWTNTGPLMSERREELYRDMIAVGRLEAFMKDLPGMFHIELTKQEQRR